MARRSRVYVAQNDRYKDIGNPVALLVLRIIQRAQADVHLGPRRGGVHYLSAVAYLESELFRLHLDFLAAVMPDFEPDGVLVPVGCGEVVCIR